MDATTAEIYLIGSIVTIIFAVAALSKIENSHHPLDIFIAMVLIFLLWPLFLLYAVYLQWKENP